MQSTKNTNFEFKPRRMTQLPKWSSGVISLWPTFVSGRNIVYPLSPKEKLCVRGRCNAVQHTLNNTYNNALTYQNPYRASQNFEWMYGAPNKFIYVDWNCQHNATFVYDIYMTNLCKYGQFQLPYFTLGIFNIFH